MRARLSAMEAEMMRMPVLIPADPRPGMSAVVLNRATCVVGARARVHLPLAADEVSKAHALIVNDRDGVYIRDLASRNHTFVNDSPVREMVLENSDGLRIGRFAFRCEAGFRKTVSRADDKRAEPAVLEVEGVGTFPIAQRTMVIGSRADCDVVLEGEEVSPAHAVVFQRHGERFVRDLDSVGGTFHNGATVRERQFSPGDVIQIGQTQIHYRNVEVGEDEALAMDSIAEVGDLAGDPEEAALKVWDSGFNEDGYDTAVVEPSLPAAATAPAAEDADASRIEPLELLPPHDESIAPEPATEPVYVMDEPPGESPDGDLAAIAASAEFDSSIPIAPPGEALVIGDGGVMNEKDGDQTADSISDGAQEDNVGSSAPDAEDDTAEPVTTGTISRLVGEVSEKAHELEAAWREYETSDARS